jgi:hypothetical protein
MSKSAMEKTYSALILSETHVIYAKLISSPICFDVFEPAMCTQVTCSLFDLDTSSPWLSLALM